MVIIFILMCLAQLEGLTLRNTLLILGIRVGGKCKQRSEGQTYHTASFTTGHQGRRGVGFTDQGNNRWWWCHPPYPQEFDRQEGVAESNIDSTSAALHHAIYNLTTERRRRGGPLRQPSWPGSTVGRHRPNGSC